MHGESNQGCFEGIDAQAEHLIVLLVVGEQRGRSRERIHRDLDDVGRDRVEDAIASLAAVGVVVAGECSVHRSLALARIDWLSMIGV
jgi:hypothetical protein